MMPQLSKEQIIQMLELKPLPQEGGFYRETYRCAKTFEESSTQQPRSFSTAIYYMVTPESFSRLHRIPQDELFHFCGGDPVDMVQLDTENRIKRIVISNDLTAGHRPQVVVPGGHWQGMRLKAGGKYALFGVTVSPAFEFRDFELASPSLLDNLSTDQQQILKSYL